MAQPDLAAGALLERLSLLVTSQLRAAATAAGLQETHLAILRYLAQANRYSDTLSAVVEYLGSTKGTVSQSLRLMLERGLIDRVPDAADKRVAHLTVTPAGRRLLTTVERQVSVLDQADAGPDGEVLATRLRELLRRAQHANGLKPFGLCHACQHHQRTADGGRRCGLTGEALSKTDATLRCREFLAPAVFA